MDTLKKIRFIDPKVIVKLDSIFLLLSLAYLVNYFRYQSSFNGEGYLIIAAVSVLNYFSKKRKNSVLAALGYGFTAYLVIFQHIETGGASSLIWLPFILFFAALFFNFSSTFISGFLLGYWMLLIYFTSQSEINGSILGLFENAFSVQALYNVTLDYKFLLLTGLIVFLFSKLIQYKPISKTMKFSQTWLLLSIPFVIFAVQSDSFEELSMQFSVSAIYILLVWFTNASIKNNNSLFSSFAYFILTFVLCYFIKQVYQIENYYFMLIVPLVILILVNFFKINARFMVGFFLAFWLKNAIQLCQSIANEEIITLRNIFSLSGIQGSVKYLWIYLVAGILFMLKGKILESIIKYLEKVSHLQKAKRKTKTSEFTTWEDL
ncbi:hypothetical protein [Neobacillus dielmonensis]|uniref:hypothetical protein n=1 Tax=Neobacillus dielmonensis TaxID=1347369 RepID=UPI0005A86010|nr:hypothetical protein [Neobacillus dielmonensis]